MTLSPETYTEQSLWPDLVPDRFLGMPTDPVILRSLADIGIVHSGEFETHFGIIAAGQNGILEQSGEETTIRTRADDMKHPWDYWVFTAGWGDASTGEVKGYIESCLLVDVQGHKEWGLRVVDMISDMGVDDMLVLVNSVQTISAVPPEVSEALIILENNQLPPEVNNVWSDYLQDSGYLQDKGSYKLIWAREQGATDAWDLAQT